MCIGIASIVACQSISLIACLGLCLSIFDELFDTIKCTIEESRHTLQHNIDSFLADRGIIYDANFNGHDVISVLIKVYL